MHILAHHGDSRQHTMAHRGDSQMHTMSHQAHYAGNHCTITSTYIDDFHGTPWRPTHAHHGDSQMHIMPTHKCTCLCQLLFYTRRRINDFNNSRASTKLTCVAMLQGSTNPNSRRKQLCLDLNFDVRRRSRRNFLCCNLLFFS
jgi:hypothetical protein